MGSGLAALNIGVDTNSAVTASANTATLETPNGMTGGLRFTTRDTSAPIRFLTDSVERMRILGSGTIQMTDENGGVPLLQARNFATSATGAFNNGYAMEFRGATTTGAGNGMMLLHMNEADDARPTLNVSYSGGIFATFTNGKVGIGTTSPSEKLSVSGNIELDDMPANGTRYLMTNETNTGTGRLNIQAGGGSAAYGGGLSLIANSHASKPGWVIAGISSSAGTAGGATEGRFVVNTHGLGTGTDIFTVLRTGNVGIGTTSPDC